jgi:aminoglycoside/choline kinase family phosphotransferase
MVESIEALQAFASDLVKACPHIEAEATVREIKLLTGDISTRRYIRVFLEGSKKETILLMMLSGQMGPVGGGAKGVSQDDTFFELQAFFHHHGIPVPDMYLDARKQKALLVEDVGDLALWNIATGDFHLEDEKGFRDALSISKSEYFKSAIELIGKLQNIPFDPECIAFQRSIGFEQYRREINEIEMYILKARGIRSPETLQLGGVFDAVCETLCSHPKVLSHVDYMGHNILITKEAALTLIDFQDASTISPVRDIVSLINDRGMDEHLGESLHRELLSYFIEEISGTEPGAYESFCEQYTDYLFHWDCRVSGRFSKLCYQDGVERYGQWIEGTLRRLGRTVSRMENRFPGMDDLIEIFANYLPEFKEGMQDPWALPKNPG